MAHGAPVERPLSPHLQVWRFTVTMAASITHRATGAALYGGTLLIAVWLFTLATNPDWFNTIVSPFVRSPIGVIILAGFVWSLCFHLINGLRHLYWDSGRGLAPKTATMTAWMTYAIATVLAVAILWAGFAARGGA